jgi:hypothetical protein
LALCLIVRLNHSANSIALVIIDIVLCGVAFVCFGKLVKRANNNRGTETQQSTSDFDANGNLLILDNIGTLHWYYNNTLNQLTKADKSNTTQYYI